MKNLTVPQDILIMAFRYALTRRSTAAWSICGELKKHWEQLYPEFRKQIVRDILWEYPNILDKNYCPGTDILQPATEFRNFLLWATQ